MGGKTVLIHRRVRPRVTHDRQVAVIVENQEVKCVFHTSMIHGSRTGVKYIIPKRYPLDIALGVITLVLIGIGTWKRGRADTLTIPCVSTTCSFATNIAWDTAGKEDKRPGTWGTTDSVSSEIPFVDVPKGYSVEILHLSGDEIAAPHGAMAPNSMAYVLVGLTNSTPYQSPYVGPGLGSVGTFLYKQGVVPASGARIPFNEDVIGTLNADNILILKQALFLSTAGVPIHMEATVVVKFRYVKN